MKTEETTTTSALSQASTPAPATQATYATQWASTLQQSAQASQYYSPYTSHYPQAAYATHYQAYAPPVAAAQAKPLTAGQSQYQTSTYGLGTTGANSSTANNAIDSSDIATLNDALGSAGVDLRAEEESLQQPGSSSHHSYGHRTYEDRTRKQPPRPAFDNRILGATMRSIGTTHKISSIPEESVTYLALCLRARLQDLVVGMIKAANHRTDVTFDRPASLFEDVNGGSGTGPGTGTPMWSILIRSDVAKQLAALEKAEREEETRIRKERKERADLQAAHAAALAAQANSAAGVSSGVVASTGDGGGMAEDHDAMGGTAKKKRKKEGPGVTARNMSEDVRKKMSNAVATQAAGLGGRYAWMTAANATSGPPLKPKPAVTSPTTTATTTIGAATTTTTTAAAAAATTPAAPTLAGTASIAMSNTTTTATAMSSWARPYVPIAKKSANSPKEGSAEQDTRTAITMRDAMFVIEKERGHGGGRGSARGWT